MAPIFSGSLQTKKKPELVSIAAALRLAEKGTRDELQSRIKRYLQDNKEDLEDDPKFAQLFGRTRKRSAQPQSESRLHAAVHDPQVTSTPSRSKGSGRVTAMSPVLESSPNRDLRDVSFFLKNQHSPIVASPARVPLPPSSPVPQERSIVVRIPEPPNVQSLVKQLEYGYQGGVGLLINSRQFLSNSRNIWSSTAVLELLYILSVIVPWQRIHLSVSGHTASIPYAPLSTFMSPAFWQILCHWFLPTLFMPVVVGSLISFHPDKTPLSTPPIINSDHPPNVVAPFDPLTASITRLAAQFAYPYTNLAIKSGSPFLQVDILGSEWRILSAAVGVAFAFAEAIALAPRAIANQVSTSVSVMQIKEDLDDVGEEECMSD